MKTDKNIPVVCTKCTLAMQATHLHPFLQLFSRPHIETPQLFPQQGAMAFTHLCFPEAKISKEWKWRRLGWGDVPNWTCESLWMWWMQINWQGHTQWGQRGAGAAFNHGGTTLLFVRLGSSLSTPRSACWFGEQQKEDDTHGPVQKPIKPPPAWPALV